MPEAKYIRQAGSTEKASWPERKAWMSTSIPLENMHKAFYPRSIAVVGANPDQEKVGFNLLNSIVEGGYAGEIYPVHPRYEEILGYKVYPRLEDIPGPVDLAVLAVNQEAAVKEAQKCGELGVKGLSCVSGGFKEVGPEGGELERQMVETALKYGMAVVGPNTLGLINTHADLCAIFYSLPLRRGRVSFISQSGGVGLSLLFRAMDQNLGVSKWFGMGNASVLKPADYLYYLAEDPHTSVIGLFLEGTEEGRRLLEAAAEVVPHKPVVAYKIGRSAAVERMTLTHTGTMAGSYRMYRDLFRQAGIFTVESADQMVACCQALVAARHLPAGPGVGILTHTAGPSIVIAEELAETEAELPPLSPETLDSVHEVLGEQVPVILNNPLDAVGLGLQAFRYRELSLRLLQDPGIHILIGIYVKHDIWPLPSAELAEVHRDSRMPVVACYLSREAEIKRDREELEAQGIPVYASPEESAWGTSALIWRGRWLREMERKGFPADLKVPAAALPDGLQGLHRNVLLEHEAKDFLAAEGVAVTRCTVVSDLDEARAASRQLGFPVVLKLASEKALHKSEFGGVATGIGNEADLEEAFRQLQRTLQGLDDPEGKITVQKMAPPGLEVIAGVQNTPEFGPVLMFGLGGVLTEVFKDVSFRMAPLGEEDAAGMLEELQGSMLLKGYRGNPPVDTGSLKDLLMHLSRLSLHHAWIKELDLNPILVYPDGYKAVDARVVF